jgi:hypothetical protein
MSDIDLIKNYLSSHIKENSKIVTPEDLEQNYLLHIATKKIKEFVPYISKHAAPSEENTLPRVHCALTIEGCIAAYPGIARLFIRDNYNINQTLNKDSYDTTYKGGFYLHKIPFILAIKPNTNLVYDADLTDETWLITYNENTIIYSATIIGELFIISINYKRVRPGMGGIKGFININMELNENILLHKRNNVNIELKPGLYTAVFSEDEYISHKQIANAEYKKDKKNNANMLSYMSW